MQSPELRRVLKQYEPKAKEMVVVAFGERKLDPSMGSQLERGGKVTFWASLFTSGHKPRCPPSGANPTALTGQQVTLTWAHRHWKEVS